jgi:hypothetical protein
VTFAIALFVAGLIAPAIAIASRRLVLPTAAVLLAAGLANDVLGLLDLGYVADRLHRLDVLGVAGGDGVRLLLLVAALTWCGPAADQVVRRILEATGLPAPEAAAEAGLRAGRWIGRLERWLLVGCVAAGQPALAVIPVGGKALFRYAEVVADSRSEQPRLTGPSGDTGPTLSRAGLVDYVIVGSLASWVQAIALGLLILVV